MSLFPNKKFEILTPYNCKKAIEVLEDYVYVSSSKPSFFSSYKGNFFWGCIENNFLTLLK